MYAYMPIYTHMCTYVCMRMWTYEYTYIQLYRVQGISRNYAQKLCGEFQAPTPKIQESPSVFSRGWPEIKKLAKHLQTHLPSMAMHFSMPSKCIRSPVRGCKAKPSQTMLPTPPVTGQPPPPPTPHPRGSQAKPCCQARPKGSPCIFRSHLNACGHLYLSPSDPTPASQFPPRTSPCISTCLLNAYGRLFLKNGVPYV